MVQSTPVKSLDAHEAAVVPQGPASRPLFGVEKVS